MSATASIFSAWREATASTFDHLLALAVVLLLPSGLLGWIGGVMLSEADSPSGWLLIRLGLDLLLGPLALLLGLHISGARTFFSPDTPSGLIGAFTGRRLGRAFALYLPIAVIIHPLMGLLGIPGIVLAYLGLGLCDPLRWLEGGKLWGMQNSKRLLLGATPLILAASVAQFGLAIWDVWSLQESTAVMFAIDQVVRTLLAVWGWAVVMRLRQTVV